MRAITFAILMSLFFQAEQPCSADPLDEGRKHLLAGRYGEAEETLAPLAAGDAQAAVLLARTLAEQGKGDDAAKTLAGAGQGAAIQAELARLAFARGDRAEARRRCEAALGKDRDQFLARWILAELERTAGNFKEAQRGYQYLVRRYNDANIHDAESLCWIGLGAARHARLNRLSDQFDFLVNELYPDAAKMDGGYWPADYQAGLLLLEKYNAAGAAKRFQAALAKNPNAAEVHAAVARLELRNHDFEAAARAMDTALKINPRSLAARLVEADLKWANFRPDQALEILQRHALAIDPTDEETLGRVAACYALLDGSPKPGNKNRLAGLEAEVLKRNPKPVEFYLTLGAMLSDRNRHDDAARYLDTAVAAHPRWIGPYAELGQLAMRAGRENDARRLLQEAFDADPFNVRVHNMLEVLDVLKDMERIEGERCVICYEKSDRLLARYAAALAEDEYPKICRRFGYAPPRKPLLEIFSEAKNTPGREWFSVRMTGLPYVGVAAATTGCIVAMVSPYDAGAPLKYNWARALRHELVHVVTLQQTGFNCPHWLTEGLAVTNEGGPPPHAWNKLLLRRLAADRLYNLDTLNFGFTRPASSDDWQLAYCQAERYVAFMTERFGKESTGKLLAEYAAGADTPQAIERAFGLKLDAFEKAYREFLRQQTAGMTTLSPATAVEGASTIANFKQHPEDADAAAGAANALLARGVEADAREAAEKALKLRPNHPLATCVLVRLKLKAVSVRAGEAPRGADLREATAALEACLDRKSPHPSVLGLLARLKQQAGQFAEAESLYLLGEKLDNVNLAWTKALARLYLETKDTVKLQDTLRRLAEADADDLTTRRKLAELALENKDYAQAARWAREAVEIEVGNSEIHRQLGQALGAQGEYKQAAAEFETAVGIDPASPLLRFLLSDALVQTKERQRAQDVLKELLEKSPDYPGAEELLESLKENQEP